MAMSMSRGLSAQDLWNILLSQQTQVGSIGELVRNLATLGFCDEFNRTDEDVDVWVSGGDAGGGFTLGALQDAPTCWRIMTGGALNDDWYIHSLVNTENRVYSIDEDGYTTVTWGARLRLLSVVQISAFWGLVYTAQLNYVEPVIDCAHFFADPVVGGNFYARSHEAAEEQTDTGVLLDAAWHDYRIEWTAASVLFYIDNVLVATHAAQVPNSRLGTEILLRAEVAATKQAFVDKVKVLVS